MRNSRVLCLVSVCITCVNLSGCLAMAPVMASEVYVTAKTEKAMQPSDESYLLFAPPGDAYSSALAVIKGYNGFEETNPDNKTIKGLDPIGYWEYDLRVTPTQNADESILEVGVKRIQRWSPNSLGNVTTDEMQTEFVKDLRAKMAPGTFRDGASSQAHLPPTS